MIFEKIVLNNFRQFYGKCEINFSTDEEKNITLIHGENGVGKTTILNAILWCFYEILTKSFEQPELLVCNETELNTCSVEVIFISEDKKYSIIRHYKQKEKLSVVKMFQIIKGNNVEIKHPKSLMNQILPQDMAPYFFFHGEGAARISGKKTGKQFRDAIRDILGFTFAEALLVDLQAIEKDQQSELRALHDVSEQTKRDAIEYAEKLIEQTNLNKEIIKLKTKIKEQSAKESKYNEKIRKSNNATASQLKKDILDLQGDNRRLEVDLKRENIRKQSLIQEYGWIIFGQELANKKLDFIDLKGQRSRFPAPYDREVVDSLIEDGICMCGRELIEGSHAYECILKKLEDGNTTAEKNKLTKATSVQGKIRGEVSSFLHNVNDYEKVIAEKESLISSNSIEEKELQTSLDEIEEDDISKWESIVREAKNQISSCNRNLGARESELLECISEIARLKRQVDKGGPGENPAINRIMNYIELIKELKDRTTKRLENFEIEAKHSIAKQVDFILEKWSRKDYKVHLSDDFEFSLVKSDGSVVAKSDGERLLLNLSFISSLMKFSAQRADYSEAFLLKGAIAPFVIDAPFGDLDTSYKGTVASYLPENSRQLVLMLSTSHWEGVDPFIRKKIGKEFLLINNNKTKQDDQPSDSIIINGTTYNQSEYESDHELSHVKEVLNA
jgi:DNA sulfur modification protein DndD